MSMVMIYIYGNDLYLWLRFISMVMIYIYGDEKTSVSGSN